MSYCHMFYGLDLKRLQSIFGSKDERLISEVLKSQGEALADNDGFFEDDIAEGDYPSSETALLEIVAGEPGKYDGAEAVYGYVLKILCEHVGEMIGGDVAAVRDHPYKSKLVASGPPLPIPYDHGDFPEIGFLALADIPAEIERIDKAPRRAKKSIVMWGLRLVSGGMVGREMNDEEVGEDMVAYREVHQEALDRGLSIVSFRH